MINTDLYRFFNSPNIWGRSETQTVKLEAHSAQIKYNWYDFQLKIFNGSGGCPVKCTWIGEDLYISIRISRCETPYAWILVPKNLYMYGIIFGHKNWYTYLQIFTDFSQESVHVQINFQPKIGTRTYRFLQSFLKNS